MTDAGQHFGAIRLDKHAAPTSVTALPSPQFCRHLFEVERQASGHAFEDYEKTLPVRLAGRQKAHHSKDILYEVFATLRRRVPI